MNRRLAVSVGNFSDRHSALRRRLRHYVWPLIDRLVHNAEIVAIEGESYRLKEARERTSNALASAAAARREQTHETGAGADHHTLIAYSLARILWFDQDGHPVVPTCAPAPARAAAVRDARRAPP